MELKDRVALVTGGRGIEQSMAPSLAPARAGVHVTVVDMWRGKGGVAECWRQADDGGFTL
jgi:NAD(P)-dependent dehydrogenase (short-subunit alcohol dehydrogenase family)